MRKVEMGETISSTLIFIQRDVENDRVKAYVLHELLASSSDVLAEGGGEHHDLFKGRSVTFDEREIRVFSLSRVERLSTKLTCLWWGVIRKIS